MKLTQIKKILPLIIVGILLIIIITSAVVLILIKPSNNNLQNNPQFGNTPDTDPVYLKQAQDARNQAEPPDPYQAVAKLILKLPYKGNNFSLDYSYDDNTFTLMYKKGLETPGNAEFNQFLLQNNVDKKYMTHLITKSQ